MVKGVRWWHFGLLLSFGLIFAEPVSAELQSANYRLEESAIGSGGLINSSSTSYQARSATGDIAIGNSASANYQVEAGSKTTPDPTLTFIMDDGSANLGNFSASLPAVSTAKFSVANYTSYGYVVQIAGTPPANGAHTIDALSANGSSQVGTEQFGLNLVANTSPASFGANPDHGDFGVGSASTNYDSPNSFRFVSGETIASAPKTSGLTTYTISYLVNVAGLTPGGQYKSNQTIIVTGTY